MPLDLNSKISLFLPLRGATQALLKEVIKGSGSLSFARATTAMRVDPATNLLAAVASGEIRESGRWYKNHLAYSEDPTGWTLNGVSATVGATAPNGKSVAWKLAEDTATSNHRMFRSMTGLISGAVYTMSVYAKAGGRNYISLIETVDASTDVFFNLAAGTCSGTGAAIASVGDGWYRCSRTWTATTGGSVMQVRISSNGTEVNYAGDGTSGVYLFGAQVERASAPSRYVKTTTAAAYVPKGVLIEGQRTNLAVNSEDLSGWTKYKSTITTDGDTAPDGTATAERIICDATAGSAHVAYLGIAGLSDSVVHTYSVFVKKGAGTFSDYVVVEWFDKAGTEFFAYYNLTTGVNTYVSAGITTSVTAMGNGWFRIAVTGNTLTGASTPRIYVRMASGPNTSTFDGDGTSYILAWGAQLEVGAYASSYIPTGAAAATRNADVLSIQTTSNILATKGTARCRAITNTSDASAYPMILSSANTAYMMLGMAGATRYLGVYDGSFRTTASPWANDVMTRMAMRWSNVALLVGASTNGGDVKSTTFDGTFEFTDSLMVVGRDLYGSLAGLIVYNGALSDAEMTALTNT